MPYVQRVIHKFPQQIHILSGKIQKKKLTTQAGRMEFFTLITEVSSRSDHPDTHTGQASKDELILAYGRKCLEKKHGCHIGNAQIE